MSNKDQALRYHSEPTPGKVAIVPTKPCDTARDLSLAYSPGVAEPCLAIAENTEEVYQYTSKGNLVAVVSNGTAVLGLGDIGPEASKPVMEGKGVLFKIFADIDVFDLELTSKSIEHFVETVAALEPTFGGINLEDIKAPECFEIERQLQERMDIPVFHDDQHGTAIIASAALINAIEITKRDIKKTTLVISGAGAAGIACARLLVTLGLSRENIILCDTQGVVYQGREKGMNQYKEEFATTRACRTVEEALVGADVFFGLSKKGLMSPEMLNSMAKNPIVFAMANPDPEIDYDLAKATRADVIMATGRSDFPNQVNNVLGFPFIFRGALDVRASAITEGMKIAASKALAALAKEPVPESVRKAYGNANFTFGPDYLIPKPFDNRVLYWVAPAVAKAAIEEGVARAPRDLEEYTIALKSKKNKGRKIVRGYYDLARGSNNKRVVLAEGANELVIKAALMAKSENIADPVLIGNPVEIQNISKQIKVDLDGIEIINPAASDKYKATVDAYFAKQTKKGFAFNGAELIEQKNQAFATAMLAAGDADGLICGIGRSYSKMLKPIFDIVGLDKGVTNAAGLYLALIKGRLFFLADTTINVEMNSAKLADVAIMAAEFVKTMQIVPRVAMLSFSNFGSVPHEKANMVREATLLVKEQVPDLLIEGEMTADTAVMPEFLAQNNPDACFNGAANVLIFPDMQSGHIALKLLHRLADARVVGPVILGLKEPAYVMQRHASMDEIFNMIVVAAARAALNGTASALGNLAERKVVNA